MARKLIQSVTQYANSNTPERVIAQFIDNSTGENQQAIINIDDMTATDMATFTKYKALMNKYVAAAMVEENDNN